VYKSGVGEYGMQQLWYDGCRISMCSLKLVFINNVSELVHCGVCWVQVEQYKVQILAAVASLDRGLAANVSVTAEMLLRSAGCWRICKGCLVENLQGLLGASCGLAKLASASSVSSASLLHSLGLRLQSAKASLSTCRACIDLSCCRCVKPARWIDWPANWRMQLDQSR
jgi:hypothetical protein